MFCELIHEPQRTAPPSTATATAAVLGLADTITQERVMRYFEHACAFNSYGVEGAVINSQLVIDRLGLPQEVQDDLLLHPRDRQDPSAYSDGEL